MVLLVATVGAQAQTDQAAKRLSMEARVRAEVSQFKGRVSLFAKNLDNGTTFELGGDDRVSTASTIKIAIMVEAFARVNEGKVKWTDDLVLTKEKKVGGSGILGEFADGLHLTFRDAVSLMMIMWVPTLWIIWRYLPETKGLELEDIAEREGMVSAGMVP